MIDSMIASGFFCGRNKEAPAGAYRNGLRQDAQEILLSAEGRGSYAANVRLAAPIWVAIILAGQPNNNELIVIAYHLPMGGLLRCPIARPRPQPNLLPSLALGPGIPAGMTWRAFSNLVRENSLIPSSRQGLAGPGCHGWHATPHEFSQDRNRPSNQPQTFARLCQLLRGESINFRNTLAPAKKRAIFIRLNCLTGNSRIYSVVPYNLYRSIQGQKARQRPIPWTGQGLQSLP
uniref:Uncharacterized protein n=1 Tax=Candidatus Kentrum sp. DK TaxID=2126562 RepID=A0A450RX60_9GAMM|nr:MAG: hypothetical protein BECKDK2373B_GA0170837_100631 [Candidatus Kentron sp. DK]